MVLCWFQFGIQNMMGSPGAACTPTKQREGMGHFLATKKLKSTTVSQLNDCECPFVCGRL